MAQFLIFASHIPPQSIRIQNVSPPKSPHQSPPLCSHLLSYPAHSLLCDRSSWASPFCPSAPATSPPSFPPTSCSISGLSAPSSFHCAFLAPLCLPLCLLRAARHAWSFVTADTCHIHGCDLSRPSVVPGCPPLQLKPSHFPVLQTPISLKNPSQRKVVQNWLSCPGAEADCPNFPGYPAPSPCLEASHCGSPLLRPLQAAFLGLLWVFQLVPGLSHPMSSSSSSGFLALPLAAKSKNLAGLRGYFSLPLPTPVPNWLLPPPILQHCHSPLASVSMKPRGAF